MGGGSSGPTQISTEEACFMRPQTGSDDVEAERRNPRKSLMHGCVSSAKNKKICFPGLQNINSPRRPHVISLAKRSPSILGVLISKHNMKSLIQFLWIPRCCYVTELKDGLENVCCLRYVSTAFSFSDNRSRDLNSRVCSSSCCLHHALS